MFDTYEEEIQFRVVTGYGSEIVENDKKLWKKLDYLQKDKYGFVSRYIVSTWGKKLYMNPNEIMGKDSKTTKFDYLYFEFGES